MSFSERPELTGRQKFGCGVYFVFALIASIFLFLLSTFGQCGAWAGSDCVQPSPALLLAFFPGGPIALFIGGILLTKYFKRDKD